MIALANVEARSMETIGQSTTLKIKAPGAITLMAGHREGVSTESRLDRLGYVNFFLLPELFRLLLHPGL
jgi:hypothetical protein